MGKLSSEEKRSHNRAIVVLVLGLFTLSWVMVNSGEFLIPAVMYIVLGSISVVLYLVWNKF